MVQHLQVFLTYSTDSLDLFLYLHILPLLPSSAEHIPLLWRGDDDVALGQQFEVGSSLSGQDNNLNKSVLEQVLR